ncbi:hypothetical protein [Salmonella enterica]|uniref:hypothetical protein n=1 Tax=Salmonella enterica TaxID=28901 RepID=UPI0021805248|nr:hypothetical protein [Salmonella enterica]
MSRYNEISQYFNSDISASMDVERYTHIAERTISTDLKIIDKYGEEEYYPLSIYFSLIIQGLFCTFTLGMSILKIK